MRRGLRAAALAVALAALAWAGAIGQSPATPDAGEWASTGRTFDEQHYSPLDQIDEGNVGRLGLACCELCPRALS